MSNDRDFLHAAASKDANCLAPDALERIAAGTATDAEKAHTAACVFCQSEVALLQSFAAAEPTAAETAAVRHIETKLRQTPSWRPSEAAPQRFWSWRPVWALGLAAALGLVLYINIPGSNKPFDDTVRSGQIESITPIGDLTLPPGKLQWRAVSGAVSYEIRLTDITETTLWQTSVPVPTVELPPAARALMTERRTLTWRIRAMDGKGATLAASAPESFRVVTK